MGFDAAVEFPPHGKAVVADPSPRVTNPTFVGNFYDYVKTAENFMRRPSAAKRVFRAAMPSWDNTARRQDTADIFVNTSPESYRDWLHQIVRETRCLRNYEERIVFVNAWNEWAEGNHLEPDRKHGHGYLQATRDALGEMGYYDRPVPEDRG
jgi:lipopolysaccharide biosynthesis protein